MKTFDYYIQKYALLQVIITLLLFAGFVQAIAQSEKVFNAIQADTIPVQDTIDNIESNEIVIDGIVMPQFYGGDEELMNWLFNNVRYPDKAAKKGIQGIVVVKFLVKADGSIKNAGIMKHADPALDKEAIRVVKKMPKWIPGTKDGKPVDVWYMLPVIFKFKKIPQKDMSMPEANADSTVVMPQFPGGAEALMKFLVNNVRYPIEALRRGITGHVAVRFIVKADGSIENIEIPKNVNPELGEEALRVVKRMPQWIPGTKDGEPVDTEYTLPIIFNMR